MVDITIGDLRNRITIQQLTAATNANGFPVEAWTDLKTVWAAKRGLQGREYFAAAEVQAESDVIYTIRYRTCITAGMRIIDGEKTMNIKAPLVDLDGRKRYLEIHASEVVPSGN